MWLIDRLAEQRIEAAERRGEFEDLPGSGKPLDLETDALLPESLRAGYRLLKNAACLPPDLILRSEIRKVETLLDRAGTEDEAASARRRLQWLQLQLSSRGTRINLLAEEGRYRERMLRRLVDADAVLAD